MIDEVAPSRPASGPNPRGPRRPASSDLGQGRGPSTPHLTRSCGVARGQGSVQAGPVLRRPPRAGRPPEVRNLLRTGRTSLQSPNIQQIPRESQFREAFVPSPGHLLLAVDYSLHRVADPRGALPEASSADPSWPTSSAPGVDPHCAHGGHDRGHPLRGVPGLEGRRDGDRAQRQDAGAGTTSRRPASSPSRSTSACRAAWAPPAWWPMPATPTRSR